MARELLLCIYVYNFFIIDVEEVTEKGNLLTELASIISLLYSLNFEFKTKGF